MGLDVKSIKKKNYTPDKPCINSTAQSLGHRMGVQGSGSIAQLKFNTHQPTASVCKPGYVLNKNFC